jgi:hypothetical protein
MKRLMCLAVLLLAASYAEAQTGVSSLYEKSYRYEKTVANGTSAYSTGKVVGSMDSLDLQKLGPLGTWVWTQNIGMVDSMKNDASYELWVFSSRPTTLLTDGQAATFTWAESKFKIAVLPFGSNVYDGTYKSFAYEPQVNTMLSLDGTRTVGRYLYYYLVIRSTKTWTVGSTLVFKITLFR